MTFSYQETEEPWYFLIRNKGAQMRGNHLFGTVIPPHRAPGVQGGAQMWGNHIFGTFSPERLKKVLPPHRAPGGAGRSPDAGESPFRHFEA